MANTDSITDAGVLYAMGETPQGADTITALSNMLTQTLGTWSIWLFAVGALQAPATACTAKMDGKIFSATHLFRAIAAGLWRELFHGVVISKFSKKSDPHTSPETVS